MARRYSHKEIKVINKIWVVIFCLLCCLIFDNWLGMTLSRNGMLMSYTGYCTKYVEMEIPRRRGADAIFYDFYMDNGLYLSAPEDSLWNTDVYKAELPRLIEQEITVYYYPGILPIPPARLVRAYIGDREIVTMEPTLEYFSNQIRIYSLLLIFPAFFVFSMSLTAFFQSAFWQRCRPKLRKALRNWRYKKKQK